MLQDKIGKVSFPIFLIRLTDFSVGADAKFAFSVNCKMKFKVFTKPA